MECIGDSVIDQSNIDEDDFIPIVISSAYAQKFTPTSKCLSSVSLKVRKVEPDADVTVRICSNSAGFPVYSSNLGEFRIKPENLTAVMTEYNFPLNIELTDLNPLWVVVTSMYDPNYKDCGYIDTPPCDELINVAVKYSTNVNENFAFKSKNDNWINARGTLVFKTFKQSDGMVPKYRCENSVCVRDDIDGTLTECTNPCDTTSKKYSCIDGTCMEYPNGKYVEPTCNNECLSEQSDNTGLYIAILGLSAFYLLTRKKQ